MRKMLEPAEAVMLMVKEDMVLRDMNYDGLFRLIWWNGRCSCFHYLENGRFSGIYGGFGATAVFYNCIPYFKFRKEQGDNSLLYRREQDVMNIPIQNLIDDVENRKDREVCLQA